MWILKLYPSLRRKHSLYVCFANSLVGLNITALNPFFSGPPKWWIIGNKNAAVFPDPVGAQANICLPYFSKDYKEINNFLLVLIK